MKRTLGLLLLFYVFGIKNLIAAELPKTSIYQSHGVWQNERGEDIPLQKLRGNPVIIAMVYTGCEYACPMTIGKLKKIEKQLIDAKVSDYQFVLASFDTVRDRPKDLAAYVKKHQLDPKHWMMLSNSHDGQVRELAILLNVNFKKEGDKDFSHSNIVTLLDRDGVMALQLNGFNADDKPLVAQVVQLNGKPKP